MPPPPEISASRYPPGLILFPVTAAIGTALDLFTKHLAFSNLGPHDVVVVVPDFVNFRLALNQGAACSMMSGAFAVFVVVSAVALAFLTWFAWSSPRGGRLYNVMLGFIASGVLGNLYDRIDRRAVRDFVDVYVSPDLFPDAARWLISTRFGTNHWPTFNVADAFICVGTGYLLVKFWRDERAARREAAGAPAAPAAPAAADDKKAKPTSEGAAGRR